MQSLDYKSKILTLVRMRGNSLTIVNQYDKLTSPAKPFEQEKEKGKVMETENQGTNWGCIIIVVLFVIGSLVFFFLDTSYEEISGIGFTVLGFGGVVAGYFIIKKLFGNKDEIERDYEQTIETPIDSSKDMNSKGCLKIFLAITVCLAIIGGIVYALTSSESLNYVVGILVAIVLAIGIGFLFYRSFKDE